MADPTVAAETCVALGGHHDSRVPCSDSQGDAVSKLRVNAFSVSADGFGAGPDQP